LRTPDEPPPDAPTEIFPATWLRAYTAAVTPGDPAADHEWPSARPHPDTAVSVQRVTRPGRPPVYLLDLTEPGCAATTYVLTADLALRLAVGLIEALRSVTGNTSPLESDDNGRN